MYVAHNKSARVMMEDYADCRRNRHRVSNRLPVKRVSRKRLDFERKRAILRVEPGRG
jgi:hypothetical protein